MLSFCIGDNVDVKNVIFCIGDNVDIFFIKIHLREILS